MKQKWNDQWKVWKEDNAFRLIFSVPETAKEVDLPYDAVFHQEQRADSVNQGRTGFLDGGVFNYYKQYFAAEEDRGNRIYLHFDGVAGRTFVYVNGSLAGENRYAYSPFDAEIGAFLKHGQTNDILVMVNAMDESTRYYCGGGICRDVYLVKQPPVHIAMGSVRCTTLSVENDDAVVRIEGTICNEQPYLAEGVLRILITRQDQQTAEEILPVSLPAKEEYHQERRLSLSGIVPWQEDSPALYDVTLSLMDYAGQVLCEESVRTGFRTVSVDARHGLRVNGNPIKLRGACIHHDQGLLGGETFEAYEYRRVRLLKEAGFNAVRCVHNPASTALLNACDALGVYVMDEAFDMWSRMKNPQDYALFFTQDAPFVLQKMVETDYNHPAVILYSTGNEITEIGTEAGYAISHRLTALLHQLDATRFTTNGINGIFAAGNRLITAFSDITGEDAPAAIRGDINECMSVLGAHMTQVVRHEEITDILDHLEGTMDILGYNYMTGRYDMDLSKHPNRVIVGTETYPKQIGENWSTICRHPALLGDFTWTGWDYLGETGGQENYPWLQNFSGDIDITGERKPVSYYRELIYGLRTAPYIAVRSPEQSCQPRPGNPWQLTDAEHTWRFDGREGQTVSVEVYSAGDEVELFLNDASLGRKKAEGLYPCFQFFDLPYRPGMLKAVSYRQGKSIGSDEIMTNGNAQKLSVTQETHCINGDTMVFLTVEGRDQADRRTRDTLLGLRIELDEKVTQLLAFGSSGSVHHAGYVQREIDALHGRALAIIRKKTEKAVRVSLWSAGLEETTTMI